MVSNSRVSSKRSGDARVRSRLESKDDPSTSFKRNTKLGKTLVVSSIKNNTETPVLLRRSISLGVRAREVCCYFNQN